MIAELEIRGDEVILHDDLTWSSGNPVLERMLNIVYSSKMFPPSPADGVSGVKQVRAVVKRLKAKVVYMAKADGEEGVVY